MLEEGSEITNETEVVLSEQFVQSGVTVEVTVQGRNSSTGEDLCDPVTENITIPGSEYGLGVLPSFQVFLHSCIYSYDYCNYWYTITLIM